MSTVTNNSKLFSMHTASRVYVYIFFVLMFDLLCNIVLYIYICIYIYIYTVFVLPLLLLHGAGGRRLGLRGGGLNHNGSPPLPCGQGPSVGSRGASTPKPPWAVAAAVGPAPGVIVAAGGPNRNGAPLQPWGGDTSKHHTNLQHIGQSPNRINKSSDITNTRDNIFNKSPTISY